MESDTSSGYRLTHRALSAATDACVTDSTLIQFHHDDSDAFYGLRPRTGHHPGAGSVMTFWRDWIALHQVLASQPPAAYPFNCKFMYGGRCRKAALDPLFIASKRNLH